MGRPASGPGSRPDPDFPQVGTGETRGTDGTGEPGPDGHSTKGQRRVRRPKVAWKWIVAVGLVLGVAKFGLLFVGMDAGMPAGLSSLVLQIQAVFTAVIAAAALGERPRGVRLLGMLVALAGIAVAAVDEGASGPLGAFALVVAAAARWGASNVLTRKAAPADALNFMVWVSTVPVLPLLALSLLVPVFGMSSAALFLDEPVSPLRWCAAALLVGGVALTSLTPRRTRPTTAPATVVRTRRPAGRAR